MRPMRVQRGMALVLVLWLVAALSLVVLAGVKGVRQQTRSAGMDIERLRAEVKLDAVLQLAAQRLLAERQLSHRYQWLRMQLGFDEIWIEITPAEGLIDVNVASDALLQALFRNIGRLTPDEAVVFASRIRDWIDPDDDPSGVGGAEAAQYRAAAWPSQPRNAALEDPSELRSVLGMTAGLYEIIAPFLGLNGQQRIDVDAAPPALIDALTGQDGLGAQIHASPPEQRGALLLSEVGAQLFTNTPAKGGREVRLRVLVASDGDQWWQREAWIDLSARPDTLTPWTTLLLEPTRRVPKPDKEIRP